MPLVGQQAVIPSALLLVDQLAVSASMSGSRW